MVVSPKLRQNKEGMVTYARKSDQNTFKIQYNNWAVLKKKDNKILVKSKKQPMNFERSWSCFKEQSDGDVG